MHMLIDWLIARLTARQHRNVNLCQLRGRKLTKAAKDSQQDTRHNTLRYTIKCNTVHIKTLQLPVTYT